MKNTVGRIALLLFAALLLILPGCRGGELRDEERQQLIAEMGEEGRQYHEKRSRFLESSLHAEGCEYLTKTLESLVPGGEIIVSIEPGGYIDAKPEELAASLETDEARRTFFSKAEVVMEVNFRDFDLDPEALARDLMARGISGRLMENPPGDEEWILDAPNGSLEYSMRPGV